MAAHLPAARFVRWHRRDRWEGGGGGGRRRSRGVSHLCEAKQLGAIKPSFAVGTIQSEDGAGSNIACSAVPFISTPHEDPVNAMGVVKVKRTVFCRAGSLLMFNIMTAKEKNFSGLSAPLQWIICAATLWLNPCN